MIRSLRNQPLLSQFNYFELLNKMSRVMSKQKQNKTWYRLSRQFLGSLIIKKCYCDRFSVISAFTCLIKVWLQYIGTVFFFLFTLYFMSHLIVLRWGVLDDLHGRRQRVVRLLILLLLAAALHAGRCFGEEVTLLAQDVLRWDNRWR